MVILLFPVLMCVLAAPLIFFGVSWPLSLFISFVVSGAAMWFILRAYKKAKHKLDNQWRG
jgi:membrane protein implicated in regulation of membrane protease activity